MTSTWDPNVYLEFTDHRLRPAVDLLARVPLAEARAVFDLGCGPGNVTRLLAERWPQARLMRLPEEDHSLPSQRCSLLVFHQSQRMRPIR